MADDGRERHIIDIVAAADLIVQRVDGAGVDAHPNLPRPDHGDGNVAQFKGIVTPELFEDHRLHGISHDLTFPKLD